MMLAKLEEEAPHFMYTLMNLQLPPPIGRLRLPVVTTTSKAAREELNQSRPATFLDDAASQAGRPRSVRRVLRRASRRPWTRAKSTSGRKSV